MPGRDLDRAIESARLAVEGDSSKLLYWHLLGLLLIASEDWRGAITVLEIGAAVGDQMLSSGSDGKQGLNSHAEFTTDFSSQAGNGSRRASQADSTGNNTDNHAASRDSVEGTIRQVTDTLSLTPRPSEQRLLLAEESAHVPPAASLLISLSDHPAPSRSEHFEQTLQLHMTQLALTELLEGAEGAGEKWVEVFRWFAEKSGPGENRSREPPNCYMLATALAVLTRLFRSDFLGCNQTIH